MAEVTTKKQLIEHLQEGKGVRPIVVYDLILNNVLTWKEFEHLFQLYYRGNDRDHLIQTYESFWKIMNQKIGDEHGGSGNG